DESRRHAMCRSRLRPRIRGFEERLAKGRRRACGIFTDGGKDLLKAPRAGALVYVLEPWCPDLESNGSAMRLCWAVSTQNPVSFMPKGFVTRSARRMSPPRQASRHRP